MGDSGAVDTMINDGLSDAFNEYHGGLQPRMWPKIWHQSRRARCSCLESQTSIESGRFKKRLFQLSSSTQRRS